MRGRLWRVVSPAVVVLALVGVGAVRAAAHPMGNYAISHYAEIEARDNGLAIAYVLDLAEIPAFEELRQPNRGEMEAHLARRAREWVGGLDLRAEGTPLPLLVTAARFACPPGVGGLPTLRMEADLWAGPLTGGNTASPTGVVHVLYRDTNFPARTGWKEIVVRGEGIRTSSVPTGDLGSNRLHVYPSGFLQTPPSTVEARFSVAPAGGKVPRRPAEPRFTYALEGCRPGDSAAGRGAGLWPQIRGFLTLGVRHIATGYDHLLFLVSLLVVGRGLRPLLKVVTAFTVAHSITLSLAVLNVVTLPSRVVESVIALSIAYVALENLWRGDAGLRRRWLVTFAFGLAHGLGFASLLKNMAIARPSLLVSLVSFNLGVEIGQVAVVAVAFLGLRVLQNSPRDRLFRRAISWGAATLGLAWFIQRALLS